MKRKLLKRKKDKRKKGPITDLSVVDPEKNAEILSKIPVRKAKTHRGRKVLESREPKVHELPKVSEKRALRLSILAIECIFEIL